MGKSKNYGKSNGRYDSTSTLIGRQENHVPSVMRAFTNSIEIRTKVDVLAAAHKKRFHSSEYSKN